MDKSAVIGYFIICVLHFGKCSNRKADIFLAKIFLNRPSVALK